MNLEFWAAIKEEWNKLVPAARYCLIFGAIFVITAITDNYFKIDFYRALISEYPNLSFLHIIFLLGILFIFTPFPILLLTRLYVDLKIIFFKIKYPIKSLNKDFYIVSFNQTAYLIDDFRKEIRWIQSWQTALDLDFVGEWTNINADLTQPNSLINTNFFTKTGKRINLRNYKYSTGLHTQGAPGT